MTVAAAQANRFSYAGNGVTTAFAYSSKFIANADLVVLLVEDDSGDETSQTITTHYTVTGAGAANGGTVTFVTAPPEDFTVVIYGDPTISQLVDPTAGDDFPVETALEAPLDKLTIIARRHADRLSRSIRQPDGDTENMDALPPAVERASQFLGFDTDGQPITAADALPLEVPADAASIAFTPAGNGAVATNLQVKARQILHIRDFGGLPSASAAVNGAAFDAAFDYLLDEGGELHLEPRAIYTLDRALDLRNTNVLKREYLRSIKGHGATLDFSAAGITSGALLALGATTGNSPEEIWSDITDLKIVGPEDDDDIKPRYSGNANDAVSTTTTVGVLLDNGIHVNLRNVFVERCYKGFHFSDCYRGLYENIKASRCIIGFHIDAGCTYGTYIKPECEFCTWAYLVRPDTTSIVISSQSFFNPLAENCTIAFHFDNNSATGVEIQNVVVDNPYIENIYDDHVRIGIAFSATTANYSTRGADLAGKIGPVSFRNFGRAVGDGNGGSAWGADRKALVFASTPNLLGGVFEFPCEIGDTVNFPSTAYFHGGGRSEDIATQNVGQTVRPGEGFAHVASTGTLIWSDGGLISASANVGTGLYDVTLREALSHADNAAITVTSRQTLHYAAVDDGQTTTTVVRVQMRTDAGVLADAKFTIHVKGELSPV